MEYVSVFEMLKIGIGPSSSHTLGPWRAAEAFLKELKEKQILEKVQSVRVDLYGSLSLTGKGHATDLAAMLGLSGTDPEYIPVESISSIIETIRKDKKLHLAGKFFIHFDPEKEVVFNKKFLPFHANGITFTAQGKGMETYESTFYSIGGGFIVKEKTEESTKGEAKQQPAFPYEFDSARELLAHCQREGKEISEIVFEDEKALRNPQKIHAELLRVWSTMAECAYIGCHTEGTLPGGLNVRRRAYDIHKKLMGGEVIPYASFQDWIEAIRKRKVDFRDTLKWVTCFSLAVNEVNASLGRVVTAPTNGSSGVIPAVLLYYLTIDNHKGTQAQVEQFLLTAGIIGSLFKKHATISAAMGGCQAEIGVSSAMAAAGLCELWGGTPEQVMIAAEIAMEHHLGLTCDPIGGLVQIPCIERNAMGAIKAINAAELALETNPKNAKVPLDKVIQTMWQTAQDMNTKYKETSEAGLAVAVSIADC
ncbi:L-serine ammonia-lyase [Capnocytophaga sp. G2]|uniref:L-serine ammonia-lyase n=1 Tax=Capnocytophaga sp. G2 TaxID=3110695 RepID=UPI002B4AA7E9|nr:L-serine ammonia-lyase [Capnocytophaga sp. G2]MEB3005017.1 L-serine ammonia-lyase [Capnocytophaga sp. G2]